jgi:hypothetical protein
MNTKNVECCSEKGTDASACRSRLTCSPCLFIWGAVLVIMIVQYFLR